MKTHVPDEHFLSSGDYLSVVRDFSLSKGISLDKILKDSELTHEQFISPPKLVNNFIVTRIGINLFNELSNPLSDAVEFGLCMTASSHGSLGIAFQCAPDLQSGYQILRDFYNTRINSQDIQIFNKDGFTRLCLSNKYEMTLDKELQRFFDFATLISIATNTYKALDIANLDGTMIIEVDASEPRDFPHQKIVGADVSFNQKALQLLIPESWQEARLSISNADISQAAMNKCADELKMLCTSDLVSRVKKHISENEKCIPTIDATATNFHMSTATLKRKLKEHDRTYQRLKDEVRLDHSIKLIKTTNLTLEEIAERLGFSDASNFSKSFKGWTGMTPKAYRMQSQ